MYDMKKFIFVIVTMVGIFVAYQSLKTEAKAQKPVIEVGIPCMIDMPSECKYVYLEGEEWVIEVSKGQFYGSN